MSRTLAFVAISAVMAQVAFGQAIVPISSLLSNQLLLGSLPNLVSLPSNVFCEETIVSPPIVQTPIVQTPIVQTPIVQSPIVQAPVPTTTIIQDSTVANNLANALQLLIVSNLLSNTLPTTEVVVPAPAVDIVSPITTISPLSLGGYGGLTYLY